MKAPINSGSSASKQLAPEGTHIGRCYQIIDKGTTFDEKWQNRKRKIQFMFELPMELAVFNEEKGEQPRTALPALTAARLGTGLVVRVGLSEWVERAGTNREVGQITRNIVDVLRRVKPRVRSATR
jgi:hypothetical protein